MAANNLLIITEINKYQYLYFQGDEYLKLDGEKINLDQENNLCSDKYRDYQDLLNGKICVFVNFHGNYVCVGDPVQKVN